MAHYGDDDKPRIPRWNGDPSRFQHWKDEVPIYNLGENLFVNRSAAARLFGGLSGPARKVGLSMSDEDLFPYASVYPPPAPPATGQAAGDVPVPPDGPGKIDYTVANRLGIESLVTRLQNKIVTQAPILKGEHMTKFSEQHEYFRRLGERISEYIIRWDESVVRGSRRGRDEDGGHLRLVLPAWSWSQPRTPRKRTRPAQGRPLPHRGHQEHLHTVLPGHPHQRAICSHILVIRAQPYPAGVHHDARHCGASRPGGASAASASRSGRTFRSSRISCRTSSTASPVNLRPAAKARRSTWTQPPPRILSEPALRSQTLPGPCRRSAMSAPV